MIRSSVVLPEPDGPEQGHELAGIDLQRDAAERGEAVELLHHLLHLDAHGAFLPKGLSGGGRRRAPPRSAIPGST